VVIFFIFSTIFFIFVVTTVMFQIMEKFITPYIYFFAANLVFVFSSAVCAYIRWVHTCPEFSKDAAACSLHYPARKSTIIITLLLMLDFPYLLNIFSSDALLYARAYSIISYPIFAVVLVRLFFFYAAFPVRVLVPIVGSITLYMAPLFYFAIQGGDFLATYSTVILWGAVALGGGIFVYGLMCIYKDYQVARERDEGMFSNPDDFPSRLARIMLWFVPFYIVLCVILPAFFDSGWVKVVRDVGYACGNIWLVGYTLQSRRPNAKSEVDGIGMAVAPLPVIGRKQHLVYEADRRQTNGKNVEKANGRLFEKILNVLVEKELYKQASLTLDELALAVGSNRKYVSQAIHHSPYLSFYKLVNSLRVVYALKLREKHPEMKQDELAIQAGFSSRFVLARWIKRLHSGELPNMQKKRTTDMNTS